MKNTEGTKMSKIESRLKELESKIDGISKHLEKLDKVLVVLHDTDRSLSSIYAEWIVRKRKEAEKTEKKFQIRVYYRSLLMGLVLGIVGNMFISYLMKTLEIFNISPEGWILATFCAIVGVFALIWWFIREIKKLSRTKPEVMSSG